MKTKIPDQTVMIAVGPHGSAIVVAMEGEAVTREILEYSSAVEDLPFQEDEIPKEPGIYMWRGTVIYDDGAGQGELGGQGEAECEWEGTFQPAYPQDWGVIERYRALLAAETARLAALDPEEEERQQRASASALLPPDNPF